MKPLRLVRIELGCAIQSTRRCIQIVNQPMRATHREIRERVQGVELKASLGMASGEWLLAHSGQREERHPENW